MKRSLILAGVALALTATLTSRASADTHKDEKLGYQVSYPSKWQPMPLDTSTSWVQARFLSNQEYYWEANKTQDWGSHKPYLDVVVLPIVADAPAGATVEQTPTGIRINRDRPYKDLKDYLDQTCRNIGGFHFSGETEAQVNGMKVIQYEITVDKLVNGERLIYGWAYYTEDAIYGLVTEILRKEEKKLKPLVLASLASLKTFTRTGSLPGATRTGEDIEIRDPGKTGPDAELTAEDLEKRRRQATERTLERIRSSLPKDWNVVEGKNFVAVTHVDARYTRSVLQHAEALRDWLEENLGYCGSGYTGRVIIRICANGEESSAYERSRGWSLDSPEIVTYQDRSGWSDWAMEWLNRELYWQWIRDKNADLRWGAPRWITEGLQEFLKNAKVKSGRLEFPADEWDRDQMRVLSREGKLLDAQQFYVLTSDELYGDGQNWRQTGFFVKFLLTGAGSKTARYKNVFSDYVKNLLFYIQQKKDEAAAAAEAGAAEGPKEPTTAAEEAEMFRRRAEAWRTGERDMLTTLMEKTFGDWTSRDWAAFDGLYRRNAK